ncbi:MAG: hypothetical protein ACRESZ_02820 [Methylococcales bacterium]
MPAALKTIQNQVDLILFEEGSFAPITWLLREGYLDYADYLNWRKGEGGFLEDHFKSELEKILASLLWVKHYAAQLKLEPICEPLAAINQQPISVCRSQSREEIFCTTYHPARNRLQRDLLFDSAPAFTAKALVSAIVDRRTGEIPKLLARLEGLAPDKHRAFEGLLAQEKHCMERPDSRGKIDFLLNKLTPSAFQVLGHYAQDYLTPFWQGLCPELVGRPFSAELPEDHLSFTAFKAFQWSDVIAAIEQESGWNTEPDLLFRHAEACFKLNREALGLENWFRLFMLFAKRAEGMVRDTSHRLLQSDWRNFNQLDPDLETIFFPAWIVLEKPALAKIPIEAIDQNIGSESLHLIRGLIASSGDRIGQPSIDLRARLQELNPNLFVYYMRGRRKRGKSS